MARCQCRPMNGPSLVSYQSHTGFSGRGGGTKLSSSRTGSGSKLVPCRKAASSWKSAEGSKSSNDKDAAIFSIEASVSCGDSDVGFTPMGSFGSKPASSNIVSAYRASKSASAGRGIDGRLLRRFATHSVAGIEESPGSNGCCSTSGWAALRSCNNDSSLWILVSYSAMRLLRLLGMFETHQKRTLTLSVALLVASGCVSLCMFPSDSRMACNPRARYSTNISVSVSDKDRMPGT